MHVNPYYKSVKNKKKERGLCGHACSRVHPCSPSYIWALTKLLWNGFASIPKSALSCHWSEQPCWPARMRFQSRKGGWSCFLCRTHTSKHIPRSYITLNGRAQTHTFEVVKNKKSLFKCAFKARHAKVM